MLPLTTIAIIVGLVLVSTFVLMLSAKISGLQDLGFVGALIVVVISSFANISTGTDVLALFFLVTIFIETVLIKCFGRTEWLLSFSTAALHIIFVAALVGFVTSVFGIAVLPYVHLLGSLYLL